MYIDSVPPASRFLSTLSLRRATPRSHKQVAFLSISIHALLAESDKPQYQYNSKQCISIHALLAESDILSSRCRLDISQFLSTLSLRRATGGAIHVANTVKFLSTLSLRRATVCPGTVCSAVRYFYPRSPCGERREEARIRKQILDISIHALLAESDRCFLCGSSRQTLFLSTLSLRRAT